MSLEDAMRRRLLFIDESPCSETEIDLLTSSSINLVCQTGSGADEN